MKARKILRLVAVCSGFSILAVNGQEFYLYNHAKLEKGIKPDTHLATDYIQEHLSEILPDIPDVVLNKKYPLSPKITDDLSPS